MFESIADPSQLWIVVSGFVISFVLAFGIGANDVANSFGTSVGAKVLTLKQACILATVFEISGSLLLGAKVSETIRQGIIDPSLYNEGGENDTELLLLGLVAALGGSCVWLLIATFARVPVSGTHSIVGATVGFSLVAKGFRGVNWAKLGHIVISWFASPVLSAGVSVLLFFLVQRYIINKKSPLEYGLRALPFIYGITIATNLFSIFHEGPFDLVPLWGSFVASFGIGLFCSVVVKFLVVPPLRRRIQRSCERARLREKEREAAQAEAEAKAEAEKLLQEANNSGKVSDAGRECTRRSFRSKLKARFARKRSTMKEDKDSKNQVAVADSRDMETMKSGEAHDSVQVQLQANGKCGSNSKFVVKRIESDDGETKPLTRNECTSTDSFLGVYYNKDELAESDANVNINGDCVKEPVTEAKMEAETESETKCCGRRCKSKLPAGVNGKREVIDSPECSRLFSFLQILTAIFGAFAHGGNDVSNAIGPLIGIWIIATTGRVGGIAETPWWILMYGGLGISFGLWIWGRRVIRTLGEDLTKVTPSSGFCIELGAALTVLIASNAKLPISTTHCKVGSVVGVGRYRSRDNVDWRVFRNIILAWFVTVPASAALGAGIMFALMQITKLVSPPVFASSANYSSNVNYSTVDWYSSSTSALNLR